jgi:ketosteroid isomerase-like protein
VDSRETVDALFAAFSARDVEAGLRVTTDDISFWPEGTAEEIGREAPYEGLAGMRRYFADVEAAWTSLEIRADSTRVAGQGVIAFGRARGTTVNGREVDVPVIWVIKMRDGLVASVRAVSTAEEAQRAARA